MSTQPQTTISKTRKRVENLSKKATEEDSFIEPVSQCKVIARKGVQTDRDFANLMNAIIGDLAEGSLSTEVGNAMVNAGGKLLKVVEMRLRYGTKEGESKVLNLLGS